MKKTVLLCMVVILVLFLLPSCASGVSMEEYNKVSSELTTANSQIQSLQATLTSTQSELDKAKVQLQSLQSDKTSLTGKSAEALTYTEFLDLVLYPAWTEAKITPRFTFNTQADWYFALKNKATSIGDVKLSNYLLQVEKGDATATPYLMDYCMETLENTLK